MENTKRTPALAVEIVEKEDGHIEGLVLRFSNGEVLAIEPVEVPPAIAQYALWHGLKQKLVDAAAISRNPETGRSATVADKYAAVKVVYDRLLAGEWNAPRGSGTGSGGLLFRALCAEYPSKTPEVLREWLAGKSKAEQAALRKNPKIAMRIEELRAAPADDGTTDTEELLSELDGIGDDD